MKVAIVHLGRSGATGERRRVASLRALFTEAGAEVSEIGLISGHRRHIPLPRIADVRDLISGAVVPETQAWNLRSARAALLERAPDLVVFVTLRAFHPQLLSAAPRVVVDYVDSLSDSYRDRAGLTSGLLRSRFLKSLAYMHGRAETRKRKRVHYIAAGWTDAQTLACDWLPITAGVAEPRSEESTDTDIGFVGNLAYPPNVEALQTLARAWPFLKESGRKVTCLIAGAKPVKEVWALARANGWEVVADFRESSAVYSRMRLAVSPISHSSGMQIKAIDAASSGVPQVVSSALLRGYAPGFPAEVADTPQQLASAVLSLLDNPARRQELAENALTHVTDVYSTAAWLPQIKRLLSGA
jgi:glycosyltransferase involved in cell wall biosynthesis